MKVYIVGIGDYSDQIMIRKVFLDKDKAYEYAKSEGYVEDLDCGIFIEEHKAIK